MHQNDISDNLQQWNKISQYSKWMFEVYEDYVGKRVLDVGGGVGTVISYYIENADLVVTTELFDKQIDMMRERFKEYDYFHAYNMDLTTDDLGPLKKYTFDTIICINVLEHIEKDLATMQLFKTIVQPGGVIVICVPANSKLYCHLDKNAGHYRRYDKGQLREMARKCDLEVLDNFYFNLMGIIPYYIKGKFGKDKGGTFSSDLKDNNSKIYNLATRLLKPIERVWRPGTGISEFIVLKKKCLQE